MSDLVALRTGTILVDDYRIERVLGAGGFGITYLAEEVPLARLVTIKEYFPVDFAARDSAEDVVPRSRSSEGDYTWGLDRFLAEAQTLARFNHPNIVRVYRFFQARNTGYIVLHYEEGQSLKGWLRSLARAPRQHELDRIVEPLLGALETVHAADYLHRDIAPDNIMIRRDGAPVLIDFGSARGDIAKHSKTISALVKPGYSPYEQYATTASRQGPWTDIYSLGATLYEAVTNRRPPDAPSRMVADEMIPPADAALSSYRPGFLAAIARSLRLEINERPRSVAEWRAELMAPPPRVAASAPEPVVPGHDTQRPSPAASVAAAAAPVEAPLQPQSPAAAGANGGRPSLAGAFLAGWRKANPEEAVDGPVAPSPTPAEPAPAPKAKPGSKAASATRAAAAGSEPAPAGSVAPAPSRPEQPARRRWGFQVRPEPIAAPEPGARRATPRALRRRAGGSWRSLAVKLVVGLCVAGAAVVLQDRLPTVRHEGAGVLTSQSGADVPIAEIKGQRAALSGLAVTFDGRSLITTSVDGKLRIWGAQRGNLVRTIELDAATATSLALAEGRAAVGHPDGTVTVVDLATGARLAGMQRAGSGVSALTFAGRPDRLAAGSDDGAVAIWSLDQPSSPKHVLEGHDGAIRSVAFARRGPFVASGSADGLVKLWSLDKAQLVRTYRGHDALVTSTAFNADGTVLASADRDGQIRLWSTFTNRLKKRLRGHQGAVAALAFAPDGDHLVSGGSDGTVRIWDVASGKVVRAMQAGAPMTHVLVAPDGRRIVTCAADGTVRLWDANLPKPGI